MLSSPLHVPSIGCRTWAVGRLLTSFPTVSQFFPAPLIGHQQLFQFSSLVCRAPLPQFLPLLLLKLCKELLAAPASIHDLLVVSASMNRLLFRFACQKTFNLLSLVVPSKQYFESERCCRNLVICWEAITNIRCDDAKQIQRKKKKGQSTHLYKPHPLCYIIDGRNSGSN